MKEEHAISTVITEVAVVTLKDSSILLAKSAEEGVHKDKWVVPSCPAMVGKSLHDTAVSGLKAETGVTVEPGTLLFVSEVLTENEHRIVIFVEGTFKEGEPSLATTGSTRYSDVRWVDVRKLYELNDSMPELTLDTMFKYSQILRARALQKQQEMQRQGLINPAGEIIN